MAQKPAIPGPIHPCVRLRKPQRDRFTVPGRKYLPGRPAAQIYGGLCLEEKKQVLDAVAAVTVQMKTATVERWDKLVTCSSYDLSVPMYRNRLQDESIHLEDLTSIIPPAAVAQPVRLHYFAEPLENAGALTAEDPVFTATASESFCLYFRAPPHIASSQQRMTEDGP